MTHFIGVCNHCREAHAFTTAEARDEYLSSHPHDDEPVSVSDICTGCDHKCGDHEWREVGVGPCCEDGCNCRAFAGKQ